MASKVVQAAGGIVVRNKARPLVAVVQRAKDDAWVLPRGKLKRDENPLAGARREVVEETGHRVAVNEFLGAITYRAGGRAKVVQFWQMQAEDEASHDLMADIVAVEWLPLKAAVRRLSYPLEKLFLRNVGRRALQGRKTRKLPRVPAAKKTAKNSGKKAGKKKTAGNKAGSKRTARPKASHKSKRSKKRASSRPRKETSHGGGKKSRNRKSRKPKPVLVRKARSLPPRDAAMVSKPAPMPLSIGERKTILQRMLGRLAG